MKFATRVHGLPVLKVGTAAGHLGPGLVAPNRLLLLTFSLWVKRSEYVFRTFHGEK